MSSGERPRLWVSWAGGTFRAQRATVTIGRGEQCDLVITDDPGVSRRHAQLKLLSTAIKLSDLNSRNGTFVAGRRLTGSALLSGGELIRVGSTELAAFASEVALQRSVAEPRSYATGTDSVETTLTTQLFGGLVREVARAMLTDPAQVTHLVGEACDTAQRLAIAGRLGPEEAAVVAECAVREAAQQRDGAFLQRVFLIFTTGRLPMPPDIARRIVLARPGMRNFPEIELTAYAAVLAGLTPTDSATRASVREALQVLTGESSD